MSKTITTKFFSCLASLTLVQSIIIGHEFDNAEYLLMDKIACEAGADKGSFYHNYTKIYSQNLNHLKNKPITFVEIGVYKGARSKHLLKRRMSGWDPNYRMKLLGVK